MIDIIASLDFETTGTDNKTDRPVSVNFALLDRDGRRLPGSLHTIVAATDAAGEPVQIPEGASAVHHITTPIAQRWGAPSIIVIGLIASQLRVCERERIPLCIFNATFDWPLLHNEAARHGVEMPTNIDLLDPLVIDRAIDRYRKGKRTLSAMAPVYDVALDDAHDAEADAAASVAIVREQLKHGALMCQSMRELQYWQLFAFTQWKEHMNEYWACIGSTSRVTGGWPGHTFALDFPEEDQR